MTPNEKAFNYVKEITKISRCYSDIFDTVVITASEDLTNVGDCCYAHLFQDVSMIIHERYGVQKPAVLHVRMPMSGCSPLITVSKP